MCFFLETMIVAAIAYAEIFGSVLAIILILLLLVFAVAERILAFYRETMESLYGWKGFQSLLSRSVDAFVQITRIFGWLIWILFAVLWVVFTGYQNPYDDLLRTPAMIGSPFLFLVVFYIGFLLLMENFQGYYLQKYPEEYRFLFNYSIEEWYGPKSKRFKESVR